MRSGSARRKEGRSTKGENCSALNIVRIHAHDNISILYIMNILSNTRYLFLFLVFSLSPKYYPSSERRIAVVTSITETANSHASSNHPSRGMRAWDASAVLAPQCNMRRNQSRHWISPCGQCWLLRMPRGMLYILYFFPY